MYKALIGAGALLLATTAMPASALAWDDNGYYGNGYYNNGCYRDSYGQLICQNQYQYQY